MIHFLKIVTNEKWIWYNKQYNSKNLLQKAFFNENKRYANYLTGLNGDFGGLTTTWFFLKEGLSKGLDDLVGLEGVDGGVDLVGLEGVDDLAGFDDLVDLAVGLGVVGLGGGEGDDLEEAGGGGSGLEVGGGAGLDEAGRGGAGLEEAGLDQETRWRQLSSLEASKVIRWSYTNYLAP